MEAHEPKSDVEYVTRDTRKTPKKTLRADVPHCASHSDGATLSGGSEATLGIRFRSYPYQRAVLEANRTR